MPPSARADPPPSGCQEHTYSARDRTEGCLVKFYWKSAEPARGLPRDPRFKFRVQSHARMHPPTHRDPLRIMVETPRSPQSRLRAPTGPQVHAGAFRPRLCMVLLCPSRLTRFPMRIHLEFRLHKRQMCPRHDPPARPPGPAAAGPEESPLHAEATADRAPDTYKYHRSPGGGDFPEVTC